MENNQLEMGELVGDIEQLDLADFVMDDFVANENDGAVEIKQIKAELVEMKKEMESIKLASELDSKEIGRKLDEKIDGLEIYVKPTLLKLAQELAKTQQEQKEIKERAEKQLGGVNDEKKYEIALKVQKDEFDRQLRMEKGENEELRGKMADLKQMLEERNKEIDELKELIIVGIVLKQNQVHDPANVNLQKEEDQIVQQNQQKIKSPLFDDLQMENKTLKEQMTKLGKEMIELEEENFKLRGKIVDLEKEIEGEYEENWKTEGKIKALEGDLAKLKEQSENGNELTEKENMDKPNPWTNKLYPSVAFSCNNNSSPPINSYVPYVNANRFGGPPINAPSWSISKQNVPIPNGNNIKRLDGAQKPWMLSLEYCAECEQQFLPWDWTRQLGDHYFHIACFKCAHCQRQLSTGEQFGQDANVQRKHGVLGTNVPRILCERDYMDLVVVGGTSSSGPGTGGGKVNAWIDNEWPTTGKWRNKDALGWSDGW